MIEMKLCQDGSIRWSKYSTTDVITFQVEHDEWRSNGYILLPEQYPFIQPFLKFELDVIYI
jgi:hypothetical protein